MKLCHSSNIFRVYQSVKTGSNQTWPFGQVTWNYCFSGKKVFFIIFQPCIHIVNFQIQSGGQNTFTSRPSDVLGYRTMVRDKNHATETNICQPSISRTCNRGARLPDGFQQPENDFFNLDIIMALFSNTINYKNKNI